jgi:hypothetical protein
MAKYRVRLAPEISRNRVSIDCFPIPAIDFSMNSTTSIRAEIDWARSTLHELRLCDPQ